MDRHTGTVQSTDEEDVLVGLFMNCSNLCADTMMCVLTFRSGKHIDGININIRRENTGSLLL